MVVVVRVVPWWGVVSSAVAPVLLVGGWTVAAGLRQRGSQHHQRPAADGAADRWVMTLVLLAVGVCVCRNGPGAQAGRRARTAHPDRWWDSRRTGQATPEPATGGSPARAVTLLHHVLRPGRIRKNGRPGMCVLRTYPRAPAGVGTRDIHWACSLDSLNAFPIRLPG